MSDYPKRVRVVTPHVTSEPNWVHFHTGEILGTGHHDQQWTSYVWCTDQHGHAGWVPDFYLEQIGQHEARALRDYDATELTVAKGEVLEALDEAGGWLQCRSAAGLVGWIPADNVEPVEG
jgi:SH3-like domain-containing protein